MHSLVFWCKKSKWSIFLSFNEFYSWFFQIYEKCIFVTILQCCCWEFLHSLCASPHQKVQQKSHTLNCSINCLPINKTQSTQTCVIQQKLCLGCGFPLCDNSDFHSVWVCCVNMSLSCSFGACCHWIPLFLNDDVHMTSVAEVDSQFINTLSRIGVISVKIIEIKTDLLTGLGLNDPRTVNRPTSWNRTTEINDILAHCLQGETEMIECVTTISNKEEILRSNSYHFPEL